MKIVSILRRVILLIMSQHQALEEYLQVILLVSKCQAKEPEMLI